MRVLRLVFALLPLASLAAEVRVGMDRNEAIAVIKQHGGKDIGRGLDIQAINGESLEGLHWEFQGYDAIVELSFKNGKISNILYWSKADFEKDKSHRAKSEQSIVCLKFNPVKKTVSIEKSAPNEDAPK